jgi:hypothetical protein
MQATDLPRNNKSIGRAIFFREAPSRFPLFSKKIALLLMAVGRASTSGWRSAA